MQYQSFLNSLDFYIQISVQSRKLDIVPYIQSLEEILKEQTNDLIKVQTREYIEFIRDFTESVNIMSKSFFIAVPFDSPIIKSSGLISKIFPKKNAENQRDTFIEEKTQLEQRVAVVQQGLNRIGIRTAPLGTEELVELYFKIYNPGEKEIPDVYSLGQNQTN